MSSKSDTLLKKIDEFQSWMKLMEKLEDNEEVKQIIERRYPAPSLGDLTPELIKKLNIKTPHDLFRIIDRIRYLWAQDKFDMYQNDHSE